MSEIGIDVVSINRIEKWLDDKAILNRVFTEREISGSFKKRSPHKHLAGRFAAKEAAMKALGSGWRNGIEWKDIEIGKGSKERPVLNFYGNARGIATGKKTSLSITYTPELAIAMVVLSD